MYKKILLPIDGSDNSNRAAEHAINIVDINNGDITVLFVVEPYYPRQPLLISALPTPGENYYNEIEDEGEQIITDFKKKLEEKQCQGKCKNIHITSIIKEGKAYIEILKAIYEEKVDLVILGASGRHSTVDRFMLGSVTERVISEARVPVMVIP